MYRLVIDANKRGLNLNLRELLQYRDLFLILAYRDLRVRYAQTFLGLLWAVIQPLATLVIFTLVFGRAIKVDTGDIPYPLFAVCGMAAWSYFAFVLGQSGNSVISSQEMIKKIYFPRLVIPLSKALVGFVDFLIALLFIVILLFFYNYSPSSNIVFFPFYVVACIVSALSVGIWLSALTIRFRDFQHIVPFLVQFGLYATPVGYPAEIVTSNLPQWAIFLYYLNPLAGIAEGFRWTILGGEMPSQYSYISLIIVLILFVSGLFYFRKVEKIMADIV
ncbi:ABC transporter permease [Fulvivirga sp. M361]|uniref:ABC transporter permease n=1 Tax=Fulvivirga sp. M361 TaxID=2594266 RepID=UPI00117AAF99|nr:ABC transporter permease [Fulvivirga sp. M361]TRX55615.1 ABC transporter permease [Fulvivirga sp. M361]